MNNKRMFAVPILKVIGALLLAAFAIAQTAQADANNRHEKLFGAWNVEVVTVGQGTTFPALLIVALIGSAEGPLSTKLKVVGTLRFDSATDSWNGPFKIDGFDPSENVIFSDQGTFSLTRIAVERLE